MEAYLYGRMGGSARSFTLPDGRPALDEWVAACRESATDRVAFDRHHKIVTSYLDRAADANAEGTFPSITWTDDAVPVTVAYHLIPKQ